MHGSVRERRLRRHRRHGCDAAMPSRGRRHRAGWRRAPARRRRRRWRRPAPRPGRRRRTPTRPRPRAAPSRRRSAARAMASSTSSASGSSCDRRARSMPAVRAATRNVTDVAGHDQRRTRARCPATPAAASSPSRRSRGHAPRTRAPRATAPDEARPDRQEHDAERRHDDSDRDQRHRRPHRRGQHEQHDRRSARPARPGRPSAPRRRPAAPRPRSPTSRPCRTAAVHVAEHAAGQRRVEELRAVVRGDRGAQRQLDAEPAGDQAPPPGAAHRGQHRDAGRRRPARRPSTVRTPSRNGPVPSRQTSTARIAAPPSEAHPRPHVGRLIRGPARRSSRRPPSSDAGRCEST